MLIEVPLASSQVHNMWKFLVEHTHIICVDLSIIGGRKASDGAVPLGV